MWVRMKRIAVCLVAVVMAMSLAFPVQALADEAPRFTVTGKIRTGSTASILYIDLDGDQKGIMNLKLDDKTEFKSKVLLPGSRIIASVYRGDDAYVHAASISAGDNGNGVTVDTSNLSVISGVVWNDTTNEILKLYDGINTYVIKIDPTTNMDNLKLLMVGRSVTVAVARGSDSYLHAYKIVDGLNTMTTASAAMQTTSGTATTTQTQTSAVPAIENMTKVAGTVRSGSNAGTLYLDTPGGIMNIRMDSATNSKYGKMLVPGTNVSVYVYRGSDAYLHAGVLLNDLSGRSTASADTSNPYTVTGKVHKSSTPTTLYLDTPGGLMTIRIDNNSDWTGSPLLFEGSNVTVTCGRAADEYLHVISIK